MRACDWDREIYGGSTILGIALLCRCKLNIRGADCIKLAGKIRITMVQVYGIYTSLRGVRYIGIGIK